jgi:hypothetical protein
MYRAINSLMYSAMNSVLYSALNSEMYQAVNSINVQSSEQRDVNTVNTVLHSTGQCGVLNNAVNSVVHRDVRSIRD